jgi:hypothetical protein
MSNPGKGKGYIAWLHILPLITDLSLPMPRNNKVYFSLALVGMRNELATRLYA